MGLKGGGERTADDEEGRERPVANGHCDLVGGEMDRRREVRLLR